MNVYVVVEGSSTEPQVYRKWIPLVNPALSQVDYLEDVQENNFVIRSGGGYPYLLSIINAACADIASTNNFDRLVVAVDSEDKTYQERFDEIEQHILATGITCAYHIVVQHFCFESWALGNRKFGPRNPRNSDLKSYKQMHDVLVQDPELLPSHPAEELNRAQFADKYLRLAIREKGNHLSYSKNRPDLVAHPAYFRQMEERLSQTGHIPSFQNFINAFS